MRAALGAPPGSPESTLVGLRSTEPEHLDVRAGRAVTLALLGVHDAGADLGTESAGRVLVDLSAADAVALGRVVARLEMAAAAESLRATSSGATAEGWRIVLEDA